MICFDVSVNGKKVARAGIATTGVMGASVEWARHRLPGSEIDFRTRLRFNLGGLENGAPEHPRGEHVDWNTPALSVGDRVLIRIVEAKRCDSPSRRAPVVASHESNARESRSLRDAIAERRRVMKELAREISRLEGELQASAKSKSGKKRRRAGARKAASSRRTPKAENPE